MSEAGGKVWYSAAELAELALPGMPATKRKLNEYAAERRWAILMDAAGAPLARQRAGRGGGMEYHRSLLPPAAVQALIKRGLVAEAVETSDSASLEAPKSTLWSWYERQSDLVKAEARRRVAALDALATLTASGLTRSASAAIVARQQSVSTATVWNWEAAVRGCPLADRLPRLAPRRQGGGVEAEIDPRAWRAYLSDYLRPERPTHAGCYERLKAMAASQGWGDIPHAKTLARRLEREVDGRIVIARREGADALRRMLPPQERSVDQLHAMELVNIDGHRWDVFVRFPDGRIARPMMVALQDVYSRKVLAWRIGETESAVQTRLAFADLFKAWGIPAGCLLDNGRAFASKWITGGTANRFRFKVRPEEPLGLLTSLGVKVHWATPYRGQSKPIERGFGDLCESGAKWPAFAGAYTGNSPLAKPENYGSSAVPLEVFTEHVKVIIAAHNAKLGRRTEAARGRSFDIAFQESYARAPIRKATPEQLRMALLAADQVRADRQSGAVVLYGNRYWTPELGALAGERVVVRFDPDALQGEVHIYRADDSFVATAPVMEAVGFQDVEAAKARARMEAEHRKAARRATELLQLMSAADLAAMLPDAPPDEEAASPSVIRPIRVRGGAAAMRAIEPDRPPAETIDFMERFAAAEGRLRLVE